VPIESEHVVDENVTPPVPEDCDHAMVPVGVPLPPVTVAVQFTPTPPIVMEFTKQVTEVVVGEGTTVKSADETPPMGVYTKA
jgi:hypothetical protein